MGSGGAIAIVRVEMAHAEPSVCQGRAGTSNREARSEDHEGVSGMEQDWSKVLARGTKTLDFFSTKKRKLRGI